MIYSKFALSQTPAVVVRQTDAVGDDAASLRVYVVVVILVLIGVALIGLALWLIRQTRPDSELLAPLERMDTRRWRELDPQDRRRSLDEVRPGGAFPIDRAQREPDVDRDFAASRPVRDFSDLADDGADLGEDDIDPETDNDDAVVAGRETSNSESVGPRSRGGLDADRRAESANTGETDTVGPDPLVIDTVLVDPSLLASVEPVDKVGDRTAEPTGVVTDDVDGSEDPTVPTDRPAHASPSVDDDTDEHASHADVDVPLMPGEGLLRRPRTDADLH